MEIGLIAYVLYASSILIWCSLNNDWIDVKLVSRGLLRHWLVTRSDLILFELHPDGDGGPRTLAHNCREDFLPVTPSSLAALMDWIPADSTLVLCNRGVSSVAMQEIQKLLALRLSRVFWLDEASQGVGARLSSADIVAHWPAQ